MKADTFKMGMSLLAEAFPAKEFNAEIYWQLLKDLEDKDFEMSILTICKGMKEIYPNTNLIAHIRWEILKQDYLTVGEAWLKAQQIAKDGSYRANDQDIICKTVAIIGGWEIKTTENPQATRAHFFKVYEELLQKEREKEIQCIATDQKLLTSEK